MEDGPIGRRSRPLPIDKNDLPPNVIDQIKLVVDRVWRRLLDAALDGLRHLEPGRRRDRCGSTSHDRTSEPAELIRLATIPL